MSILFFDAFSGASGDMILGALVDLGGDFAGLQAGLSRLARGRFALARRRVRPSALAAIKIDVRITRRDEHERNFREIAAIVRTGGLAGPVRERALEIFRRLCEAEAFAHGVRFDKVHLHEAGALDAIADVCGAAWLIESLAPKKIVCSPLNVGSGTIECRHGTYPVPGPATARLLQGVPIYAEGAPGERVTPTGAAILTTVVSEFRALPPIVPLAIGHGAGERVFPDRPNVLRAVLGEDVAAEVLGHERGLFAFESGGGGLSAHAGGAGSKAAGRGPGPATGPVGPRSAAAHTAVRARHTGPGAGPAPAAPPQGARAPASGRDIVVIETTIDDMNPQNYGFLLERALAEGALEVYFTPILMKKGRPGIQVTALVAPERFEAVARLIFQETTTIGLRYRRESRRELDRAIVRVKSAYGSVRLKVSSEQGNILQVQPEYEDCRRIAARRQVPLKDVQRAALAAWRPRAHAAAARKKTAASTRGGSTHRRAGRTRKKTAPAGHAGMTRASAVRAKEKAVRAEHGSKSRASATAARARRKAAAGGQGRKSGARARATGTP